jgi:hypothetical protein
MRRANSKCVHCHRRVEPDGYGELIHSEDWYYGCDTATPWGDEYLVATA